MKWSQSSWSDSIASVLLLGGGGVGWVRGWVVGAGEGRVLYSRATEITLGPKAKESLLLFVHISRLITPFATIYDTYEYGFGAHSFSLHIIEFVGIYASLWSLMFLKLITKTELGTLQGQHIVNLAPNITWWSTIVYHLKGWANALFLLTTV